MSDWCTIESDPGVFTSLIESFGVKNAQLAELWSMDDDSLSNLMNEHGEIYGLIFLFKWQSSTHTSGSSNNTSAKPMSDDEIPHDLFFAKQVTTNACATQAILSILFNVQNTSEKDGERDNKGLSLGSTLTDFKSFTSSFPSDLKGEAIGASDDIRTAHNSFGRMDSFLMDESKKRIATDDDDVFHFIAYVPHGGADGKQNVYELDGLKSGPILCGAVDNENKNELGWIQVARSAIQDRISKYAATEIKFNLMALTGDKRMNIQSKISSLLQSGLEESDEAVGMLRADLARENQQREQWKEENERRRHNYLPLCVELLKGLAASGTLPEWTQKAKERVEKLRAGKKQLVE
mmetsp:Transcript_16552/g.19172  ORF Transcript_16552/g.19172 Transcript_16552/m.19172 type:complete len:350 (+) Transcript_16552:115-1164(+)